MIETIGLKPDWASEDGSVALYCGDCMDYLKLMPDKSVDAVVTDPPYGIGGGSGTIGKSRSGKSEYESFEDSPEIIISEIVPRFKESLRVAHRAILTPGNKMAFNYPKPDVIGAFYQPAASGMCTWGRATIQLVLFYGRDPMAGKTIKPIHWQVTEAPDKNGHPCPKPIKVWTSVVERASLRNETILDPFMGSGTTGVACVKLGRRFIGIEKEPKYFDIAVKRIQQAFDDQALFAGVEEKQPEQLTFGDS